MPGGEENGIRLQLDCQYSYLALFMALMFGIVGLLVPQEMLLIMALAGALSGLLGIGSGAVKVLAMDQATRMPFEVSTVTAFRHLSKIFVTV